MAAIASIVGFSGILVVPLIVWFNLVRLIKRATNDDLVRMLWTAMGVPLAWLLCGVLALFAFPWVVGFVWLVIDSLR